MTAARAKATLAGILDTLELRAGPAPAVPSTDPFELVLWENVAYLVPDAQRAAAFAALRRGVGTTPERILAAPAATLRAVAALGGMLPDARVGKLLRCAEIARDRFGGDVAAATRLPFVAARKALTRFPSLGEPGAEKVLLFSGRHPVLAMDSNVLRVLRRLGFGEDKKDYKGTYRAVQTALRSQVVKDCRWLVRAYQLLRRHGQTVCKTTRPRCPECPVNARCAFARSGVKGSD